MKLIWWGDVSKHQDAGELLDMVDQIHEYAVTTHRAFVASHLEAWENFFEIHGKFGHWRMTDLLPLPASEQESDLGWYSTKSNSMDVLKLLKDKRKRDTLLTDDDVKRATLEARRKEIKSDGGSCSTTWETEKGAGSWDKTATAATIQKESTDSCSLESVVREREFDKCKTYVVCAYFTIMTCIYYLPSTY